MCGRWTAAAAATTYLVFSCAISSAGAAGKQPDVEIRQALTGSWIVAPDSPDAREDNARALAEYHQDGTLTYYQYSDRTCSTVVQQIDLKWNVRNGILTSTMPDGRTIKDEVVSIGPKTMTLHSLDDGSTYKRVKAKTCSAPAD
jgi:hypothetical protein